MGKDAHVMRPTSSARQRLAARLRAMRLRAMRLRAMWLRAMWDRPAMAPWPDFAWNSCYEDTGGNGQYGWIDLGTGIFHPMPLDIPATPPPANPAEGVGFFPL